MREKVWAKIKYSAKHAEHAAINSPGLTVEETRELGDMVKSGNDALEAFFENRQRT